MGSASMPMRCMGRWCPGSHNTSNSGGGVMALPAKHSGTSSSSRRSMDHFSGVRSYDGSVRQSLQGSPRRSLEGNPWS